ncbi:uncharacterized protein LOC103696204 [Phoenix dactylifera]|uniref:Uncharacterized protein LOC103696204 n=1 Tax=Phoenix dactylifera TaxID=42345 RepID=A0A8B7MRR1_PHODC|nr:uncharacterized protein LOC103696204 [Phoenix dactylifera]
MREEVMERGTTSVTPEVIKPRSGVRRNSAGKASTTASPSLSNSGEKPVPNYLRASTGSCHDFCKYGIKHGFEAKKGLPIRTKLLGNNRKPDEEQNQAKVLTPRERRKRLELKDSQFQTMYGSRDKVVMQKDLPPEKVIQISDTSTNQAEVSGEESSGIKPKCLSPNLTTVASLGHKPANLADESSEEGSITIKPVTSSHIQKSNTPDEHKFPVEGLCEESAEIMPVTSDNQKHIVSAKNTPVARVEEPYVEDVSTKLVVSSQTKTGIAFTEHVASSLVEESSEELEIIKSLVQENIVCADHAPINQAEGLSIQKSITSAENISADQAARLSEEQSQVKILNAGDNKRREMNKLKTAQKNVFEDSVKAKVIKQKLTDASVKKTASPVMETITSVKLTSTMKKRPSFVNKTIAPLAHRIIKQSAQSIPKAGAASAEPATSSKQKETTSPSISTTGLTGQRNLENKSIKSPGQSKIGEGKVLKPPKASVLTKSPVNRVSIMKLKKYGNMKPSSLVKTEAKVGKVDSNAEKIKEKTVYTVELKSGKSDQKTIKRKPSKLGSYPSSRSSLSASSLRSSPSASSHDSESTVSEVSVPATVKEGTERRETDVSKGKNKRTPSRTGSVHSEGKSTRLCNLKFQRGKVVNLQSEDNGPRKLRFRPAKVVSENQNGKEVGRRNFRKQRATCAGAPNTPTSDARAVVLRHQDVQDKKDTQGLLNHVIEETASKLVETRKSKVKALVGAFETVISLQENKLAPAVAVP